MTYAGITYTGSCWDDYTASVCLSVCLSRHATTAPTCGWFAAEGRAYTTSGATVLVTARHSAANVSSVKFTPDVVIRKLIKSQTCYCRQ